MAAGSSLAGLLKGRITARLGGEQDSGAGRSALSLGCLSAALWEPLLPTLVQSPPTCSCWPVSIYSNPPSTILLQLLLKTRSPSLNHTLTHSLPLCAPSLHSLYAQPWSQLLSHPRLFATQNLCCSPAWTVHFTLQVTWQTPTHYLRPNVLSTRRTNSPGQLATPPLWSEGVLFKSLIILGRNDQFIHPAPLPIPQLPLFLSLQLWVPLSRVIFGFPVPSNHQVSNRCWSNKKNKKTNEWVDDWLTTLMAVSASRPNEFDKWDLNNQRKRKEMKGWMQFYQVMKYVLSLSIYTFIT